MARRNEQVITGPKKPMPRLFMSLLIAMDTSDTVGTCSGVCQWPDRVPVCEAPQTGIKGAGLRLDLLYSQGILPDTEDLIPVADQTGIGKLTLQLFISHGSKAH